MNFKKCKQLFNENDFHGVYNYLLEDHKNKTNNDRIFNYHTKQNENIDDAGYTVNISKDDDQRTNKKGNGKQDSSNNHTKFNNKIKNTSGTDNDYYDRIKSVDENDNRFGARGEKQNFETIDIDDKEQDNTNGNTDKDTSNDK